MLNWRVASSNTFRAYTTAVKDFETVTGCGADQADAVSISAWQNSMQARGLSVNTIRQRLSALSVVSGIKVQLPQRAKSQPIFLTANDIRSIFLNVSDQADRMLLMRLLTLGTHARRVKISPDGSFMAHFLGQANELDLTAQDVTRRLKRYAKKAGLDPDEINMRTWCQSGRRLSKHLSIKELTALAPIPTDDQTRISIKPLHGIGRRSQSVKA